MAMRRQVPKFFKSVREFRRDTFMNEKKGISRVVGACSNVLDTGGELRLLRLRDKVAEKSAAKMYAHRYKQFCLQKLLFSRAVDRYLRCLKQVILEVPQNVDYVPSKSWASASELSLTWLSIVRSKNPLGISW
jgi:hypothetical protein